MPACEVSRFCKMLLIIAPIFSLQNSAVHVRLQRFPALLCHLMPVMASSNVRVTRVLQQGLLKLPLFCDCTHNTRLTVKPQLSWPVSPALPSLCHVARANNSVSMFAWTCQHLNNEGQARPVMYIGWSHANTTKTFRVKTPSTMQLLTAQKTYEALQCLSCSSMTEWSFLWCGKRSHCHHVHCYC